MLVMSVSYQIYTINNHEIQLKRCLPHFLRMLCVLRMFSFSPPLLSFSFKNLLKLLLLFAASRSDLNDRFSFLFTALLLHSQVLFTFLGVTPEDPVTHCSLMQQLIKAPLAPAVLHCYYLK